MEPTFNEETKEATLALAGDLNLEVAENLKPIFQDITEKGYFNVILDFADVTIVKSVCISLLVSVYRTVTAKEGTIKIINTTPNVKKIFEITKLVQILNVS